MPSRSTRLLVDERSACPLSGSAALMCVRSGALLHTGTDQEGQFDLAAKPHTNDRLLRIPAGWSRRIADIADRGLGPLGWADCGRSWDADCVGHAWAATTGCWGYIGER